MKRILLLSILSATAVVQFAEAAQWELVRMSYLTGDIGVYSRDLNLNDMDATIDPFGLGGNILAHRFVVEPDSLLFEDNGGTNLTGLGRFAADLYWGSPPIFIDASLEFWGLSISGTGGATSAAAYSCLDGYLYSGYYRCRPDGTSNPDVNPDGEWYDYHDKLDGMHLIEDANSMRRYDNFDALGRGIELEFAQVVPTPAAVWLFGSALLGMGWARKAA